MTGRHPETPTADDLAPALLAWAERHGRHDLPWQQDPTPYRVWASEVMLQQTQVATVIAYYQRFIARFPDVVSLAAAPLDEVLSLWTGLGYYARAGNLHRAARLVVERHGGCLPGDVAELQRLPGIGRSTAGAILALSSGQRQSILDGNARRVLARYFAVSGDPTARDILQRLWALAEACTPHHRIAEYTQAIMDLGSSVCVRSNPRCDECPLLPGCSAHRAGRQQDFPAPRRKRTRPQRSAYALVALRCDGALLLERRPAPGLWGGLWSFPMFDSEAEAVKCAGLEAIADIHRLRPQRHAFTHFDLTLHPLVLQIRGQEAAPTPSSNQRWFNPTEPRGIGLSKAVTRFLNGYRMPDTADG